MDKINLSTDLPMTDKISELYIKATDALPEGITERLGVANTVPIFATMFAHLILSECMSIIDPTYGTCSIEEDSIRYRLNEKINQHFGL